MTTRALAAVATLILVAGSARGAEEEAAATGVLAISEPPGPDAQLAELTGQLRAALAARAPGVLDSAQLRERMTGPPAPASLGELDRAYAGALAAYSSGEFEAAVRTLRTVADDLERTPPGAEAFAQWTRTLLRLARSEQELGRRVEAQAVLERLLRAAPDVRADARQYPPSFVALVEETRARLRSLEHHRLTVESQPEAQVFVEGREVGTTPVTIELPAGRYRVAGVRGGVRAPVVVADVSSEDRVVQLDMSVAEVLRPEAGPGLALGATDRPLRIITASARLGLDRAITTELLLEGDATLLVATLHEVRRGTAEREGRLRLTGGAPLAGGMDALAEFLLTGAPSPLVSTATGPSLALLPSALEQRQGLPPLKEQLRAEPSRAHGWVAFGSGIASVVAGGATIAFAVTASSRYDDARAMLDGGQVLPPRTNRDYNAVVRDGDSYRTAAIVSGVTAGLALATTAVLSYVSYQQTGEVGPFRF